MLIQTEETQARIAPVDARERHRELVRNWIERETENARYLDDPETSPANAERQMGRTMLTTDFEARLGKLNSKLVFEAHPHNPTKRAVFLVDSRGKQCICPYEAGLMTERSVWRVKVEYVPETDANGLPIKHMDRKDMPSMKLVPGQGFVQTDPTAPNPYLRRVLLPWGEQRRGWRTVLIKCVKAGAITVTDVERMFGSDNTPEWQGHMGKAALTRPW